MQTSDNSKPPGLKLKKPFAKTLGPVSDLEKHLPSDWWRNLLKSLYVKPDSEDYENNSKITKEIDYIKNITGITPDSSILDLCCGQGLYTLGLASRGFDHTIGIERSNYLIRLARKRAKRLKMLTQFSEGDARKIRLPDSSQDCVFLMGNSFSYFELPEDRLAVLKSVARVLQSSGWLVLDIADGKWLRQHFESRFWEWIDDAHFVCRERSLSKDKTRIISRDVLVNASSGVIADQFYAEKLYNADEITQLLQEAGFLNIQVHKDFSQATHIHGDAAQHHLLITAQVPVKPEKASAVKAATKKVTVVLGDPRLPDKVKRGGKFNEEDFETLDKLHKSLGTLSDYHFEYLDNHKQMLKELILNPPSLVLNLCDEGFNNDAMQELNVPAFLEMLNIHYTGASPACLAICYNKALVRAFAKETGIPVPLEYYFDPQDQSASIPSFFPALLKPNYGDSSIGITQKALVHNKEELLSYLDYLREVMPNVPILIQEFLTGNEYTVALIGNPGNFTVFPILMVDYSGLPNDLPPILGYESKWDPNSPYWNDIHYVKAELTEEQQNALVDYSMRLFERLGCHDYARFDFRADKQGNLKLLEANPNPGWCWDGKMNLMAEMSGRTYADFLHLIIQAAEDRTTT